MKTEDSTPNPEYLIKSIAEQGYTLETSIADLIDNSISAGARKIEVLVDTQKTPFNLFIADDGRGMSELELKKNMKFPSSSPEENRDKLDLGRFGLGLKTASFAQTRCFTVLSKRKEDEKFSARTWDVDHLKNCGWQIIVNSEEEIDQLLKTYKELSEGFLNPFQDYFPNTIIIWKGLYKFENDQIQLDHFATIQKELTETTKEHLQLIFHRFLEKKEPLKIKLNNELLTPFNPFPEKARPISARQKMLLNDRLSLEGFVLPSNSISESKGISDWTLPNKSLMDMEGMYIYRADRIIVFGGWNDVVKKTPRLQLARLKVEIGNGIDQLFHLNVAKSSIIIPFSERIGFYRYVLDLKSEAEKEYFKGEIRGPSTSVKTDFKTVFKKIPTNHGMTLEIDEEFPLLKKLTEGLNKEQNQQLKIILKMVVTGVNKIKRVHSDDTFSGLLEKEKIEESSIIDAVKQLINSGIPKEIILRDIIPTMGINAQSLPISILGILS